jgi:hypothetical protein
MMLSRWLPGSGPFRFCDYVLVDGRVLLARVSIRICLFKIRNIKGSERFGLNAATVEPNFDPISHVAV